MTTRRNLLKGAAAGAAIASLPTFALAQGWPNRPIRYICPWPPGGSSDQVIRALCDSVSRKLGQNIVVDNRAGAAGTLGAIELASGTPDGYLLAQLPFSVFRVPHVQKVQFKVPDDFTWIACLTGYTFGLVVRADSPMKSVQDVVDYAKKNPGKFSYASPGPITSPHLAVEEFANKAGIQLLHVPFKGAAETIQALMGDHVMSLSDSTAWGPYVESGKMRLLATYGSKRTKRWPDVPTLNELGFETVSDSPFGVCGPRGMSKELSTRIQDLFKDALSDPRVIAAFDQYDQTTMYMDTATYTAYATRVFADERVTLQRLGLVKD